MNALCIYNYISINNHTPNHNHNGTNRKKFDIVPAGQGSM